MKILQIHNYYKFPGGEDRVVENEKDLLISYGHKLIQFTKSNKEIDKYSLYRNIKLLSETTFSKSSYNEISKLLDNIKPDICHLHNIVPLISPAVYYACKEKKIPVVQTLHNYRLLCSNAYLFRNGKICEECLRNNLYHSIRYGCYRNSKIQTYAIARMVEKHKKIGSWNNYIDAYICLTEFAKEKFIQGGLPEDKLFVKPNFLFEDPGSSEKDENYFLFAGRLDVTKGIDVLIEAANSLRGVIIKVAGDGPLKEKVFTVPNINYLGHLRKNELLQYIKNSLALVFPSVWYEVMPMIIIESFACGKPVIGSNLGAIAEIINDRKTGLLFEPGNAKSLAEKIKWAIENKDEMKQMGLNARKEFEEKYTAKKNYKIIMDIYNNLCESVI